MNPNLAPEQVLLARGLELLEDLGKVEPVNAAVADFGGDRPGLEPAHHRGSGHVARLGDLLGRGEGFDLELHGA